MVDIKLLEDVIQDIDSWNYGDLKEIKLLSEEEIKKLTDDLDMVCDNEILSLCVTALHHMRKSVITTDDIFKLKRDIQKAPLQPLEKVTVTYDNK